MFDFEFDREDLISEDIDLKKANIFPDNRRFKKMIVLELEKNEYQNYLTIINEVRRNLELILGRNNSRPSLFYFSGIRNRIKSTEDVEIDYQKVENYKFPVLRTLLCIEFNLSTKEITRWLSFLNCIFSLEINSFACYYNQIRICSSQSINVDDLRSNIKSIHRANYWIVSYGDSKYIEFCKFVDSVALFSDPNAYTKGELYERLEKKTRYIQSLKKDQRFAF